MDFRKILMKKSSYSCVFVLLAALAFSGCGGTDEKYITQGIIEYDAMAVDQNNPMAGLAPTKMTFRFKEDRFSAEMTAGMGMFTTTFISNAENKTLTQLVKLLNKKFTLTLDSIELKKENDALPIMKIEKSQETKMIAGYKCFKATISFPDDIHPSYTVYYTNDIKLKTPNWNSPYSKIEGVLMEYQVDRYGMEMKFTAKKVSKEEIEEETFEIPEGYKPVTIEYMNEIFQSLQ